MYIYKVAPKSKTKTQDTYDYLSEESLKTGEIVKIELGKSRILGAILGEARGKAFARKKIIKKLSVGSVFTAQQIRLAKEIQREYLGAFGETLFSFLPTLNISDIRLLGEDNIREKKIHLESELVIASPQVRASYYKELASSTEGQILIVLPEIKQINKFCSDLNKIIPHKKVTPFHSFLKSPQKRILWNRVINGQNIIVVSTRQGLLLPFTNLKLICLDDPLNFAYQEDQAPYYQAFFVARKLKEISGCRLSVGESLPDTVSYIAYKNGKLKLKKMATPYKVRLTSPFNKFDQNVFLLEKIKKVLSRKGRVCFIGPWQNQVRLVCRDCEKEISCSCKSDRFDQESSLCVACGRRITACPFCSGVKIKQLGFSYKSIEEKLLEIFPQYKELITKEFTSFKTCLIAITSPNNIVNSDVDFDLAIFPYFDKMINFAALGYRFKMFKLIRDLSKLSIDEIFLCGEDLSDDVFANQVAKFKWEDFLKEEIRKRNSSKMPPFGKSVNIVCRTKNSTLEIDKLKSIEDQINLSIIPQANGIESKRSESKGLFFVPNNRWSEVEKNLKKINIKNCHFEINRGDYL